MENSDKIYELIDAHETLRLSFLKIKRLMPQVEAEISRMSGVGAAPGKKRIPKELEVRIREKFIKTTKAKPQFSKTIKQ